MSSKLPFVRGCRGPAMGLVLSGVLGIVGCRGSTEKNQAPLWNESTAWTVGPELLRIGANDALPGHSLFRVRMAIADPDGRVLVADGGTNEVRIFDASGTLVATLGGSGQGPAEFRMLSAIWLASGDTLVTYDGGSARLLAWPLDGGTPVGLDLDVSRRPNIYGRFESGSFLLGYLDAPQRREPGARWTDSMDVTVASVPGGREVAVGRFPYAAMFAAPAPGGAGGAVYTGLPYTARASLTVGQGGFYYGLGDEWTIVKFDETGIAIDTVHRGGSPLAFTNEMLNTVVEERVEMVPPEQSAVMRSYLGGFPWPDKLPAIERLMVDDLGCLWAQQPVPPGTDTADWSVFSSRNRWLGDIPIASNFRPTQIGAESILGIETNADGLELVVRYALNRRSGSTCATE